MQISLRSPQLPPNRITNKQPAPAPPPALLPASRPSPSPTERWGTSSYSLARMTMSMPQKMLMIQPTMTMAVRIWMRAAAMFSQKTQHTCLSGRSVRAPHSTVKAETNVPVRGQRGQPLEGAGRHSGTCAHHELGPQRLALWELQEEQLMSSTLLLRPPVPMLQMPMYQPGGDMALGGQGPSIVLRPQGNTDVT